MSSEMSAKKTYIWPTVTLEPLSTVVHRTFSKSTTLKGNWSSKFPLKKLFNELHDNSKFFSL